MRILDRNKIPYEIIQYECDTFIDGVHTAEKTGAPVAQSSKTLVMRRKSGQHYVFVIPVAADKVYISGRRIGTSITVAPDAPLSVIHGVYADVIRHDAPVP